MEQDHGHEIPRGGAYHAVNSIVTPGFSQVNQNSFGNNIVFNRNVSQPTFAGQPQPRYGSVSHQTHYTHNSNTSAPAYPIRPANISPLKVGASMYPSYPIRSQPNFSSVRPVSLPQTGLRIPPPPSIPIGNQSHSSIINRQVNKSGAGFSFTIKPPTTTSRPTIIPPANYSPRNNFSQVPSLSFAPSTTFNPSPSKNQPAITIQNQPINP